MIYICWSCREELVSHGEMDQGDRLTCTCGETCVVQGGYQETEEGRVGITISTDQDYESRCESEEARRYEEAAYGSDRDDFAEVEYPHFVERDDE